MDRKIKIIKVAGLLCLILVTGCKSKIESSEKDIRSAVPVTVSPARIGKMVTYIELSATSAFLFKAAIKAPATGYIESMAVNPGDEAEKNQLLFTIKTKEASAITNDSLNNLGFSGIVTIKATTAGLISAIDHPQGDYVAEGDQLCQIAIPGSFAFILDVPFELSGSVKLNESCEVVLPDSQVIKGVVKSRLPAMVGNSQTERFIVKLSETRSLPENLACKVRIVKGFIKAATSLPKSSILTDETMQSFWVMKLINDTMAVKVPVSTGISEGGYVQIIRPEINSSDLFLTSGNYGLGDTVFVKVLKTSGNEQ